MKWILPVAFLACVPQIANAADSVRRPLHCAAVFVCGGMSVADKAELATQPQGKL